MHDEAATHFIDMIDQTTLGHQFIKKQFGVSPKIGWQIDPFGHSATQASLLSSKVGFEGLFFGRIDHQDHDQRMNAKNMEFMWRASPSLGPQAQVFTGAFQNGNYVREIALTTQSQHSSLIPRAFDFALFLLGCAHSSLVSGLLLLVFCCCCCLCCYCC